MGRSTRPGSSVSCPGLACIATIEAASARSTCPDSSCRGADIIRPVAVTPTLEGVAVLALIVVARTFLGFSLEVEFYGRWPWQSAKSESETETSPE